METILTTLVTTGLAGGPQSLVAILFIVIAFLWIDRQRMTKEIARKDERLEKIVEAYHAGSLTLSEALTALRITLAEMKSRF